MRGHARDMFAYNVAAGTWEERLNVRPGEDRKGSLRAAHACCAVGPLLVIAGGKIDGFCETPRTKSRRGVRLFDARRLDPAYSESLPEDAEAEALKHGAQLIALSSTTFLLVASHGRQCWVGKIAVTGGAAITGASIDTSMLRRRGSMRQPVLHFMTRGVLPSTRALPIRMESPLLTLEGMAERIEPAPPTVGDGEASALLVGAAASTSSRSGSPSRGRAPAAAPPPGGPGPRTLALSARAFGFRPPADEHAWRLVLPHPHELIEKAGFAEGLVTLEAAVCVGADGADVFTADRTELRLEPPSWTWRGLQVDRGIGATTLLAGSNLSVEFNEIFVSSKVRRAQGAGARRDWQRGAHLLEEQRRGARDAPADEPVGRAAALLPRRCGAHRSARAGPAVA